MPSVPIIAAARACLGTRFRPQGRVPGLALDCVGVALVAAAAAGVVIVMPPYRLGGDREADFDHVLRDAGCAWLRPGEARSGDLLVVAPSPGRRHVAVVTDRGVVHAHAGLGRVVEGPLDPAWIPIAAWRLPVEG